MRLDQYLAIEPLLRTYFSIDRKYYYSILPTSTAFARNALFSGLYPAQLAQTHPQLYGSIDVETPAHNRHEGEFLAAKLRSLGVRFTDEPRYVQIASSDDAQGFLKELDRCDDQLVTLVVDFVDLLSHSRSTSSILKEIAPDESAFRSLTTSWFQYSALLQILKGLARNDRTIVLTTDHGSVFCTRGTEVYGAKGLSKNMRYKFGTGVTCDERHALFLSDPMAFGLPRITPETCCIVAKENYYFIDPGRFENYKQQYHNTFQHGGISMEEVIVPISVLERRESSE
jgi:hypothetical protein